MLHTLSLDDGVAAAEFPSGMSLFVIADDRNSTERSKTFRNRSESILLADRHNLIQQAMASRRIFHAYLCEELN